MDILNAVIPFIGFKLKGFAMLLINTCPSQNFSVTDFIDVTVGDGLCVQVV